MHGDFIMPSRGVVDFQSAAQLTTDYSVFIYRLNKSKGVPSERLRLVEVTNFAYATY